MDREQWARLKDTIHHLYIDQNLNCRQVANVLREQHDDRVRYVKLHCLTYMDEESALCNGIYSNGGSSKDRILNCYQAQYHGKAKTSQI